MIQRVTFIGAGNLATQLGKAFLNAGIEVVQVYSRTKASARELAVTLDCSYTTRTEKIDLTADLVIIALKDDAIKAVLDRTQLDGNLIVHTAGSVPADLLARYSEQYGVFYPLQTFSRTRDVDFHPVPICLEASSKKILAELKELAMTISSSVFEIDSDARRVLHLAAVFTCNFVNHLYYLSEKLLHDNRLDFDLLKPLIQETAAKVMTISPYEAQTGPAKRRDKAIIEQHLSLMNNSPELREIYQLVTTSIFQAHNK